MQITIESHQKRRVRYIGRAGLQHEKRGHGGTAQKERNDGNAHVIWIDNEPQHRRNHCGRESEEINGLWGLELPRRPRLGHASIKMTLDVYGRRKADATAEMEAAERARAFLGTIGCQHAGELTRYFNGV
jgi:hypothetical protein